MFQSFQPNYELWKKEFEKNTIDENTVLIWHSCWAWFIVRWLSENNSQVWKVVLVAPRLDPKNEKNNDFFKFDIDENIVTQTKGITIFASSNDMVDVQTSVGILKNTVMNLKIKLFKNYGHFCFSDMWTVEFPELIEEIVK